MIKDSKLQKKLEKGDWEATVENDEDCYAQLYDVSLENDEEGFLRLSGKYGFPDDSARYGASLGDIVVEIDGVRFSASRIDEDEIDQWEISGEEIDYDKGLSEEDLLEIIEGGDLPYYDPDAYGFDEDKVTLEQLIELCVEYPKFIVRAKDGNLMGFDDEKEIPKGARRVKLENAIKQLHKEGKAVYDMG